MFLGGCILPRGSLVWARRPRPDDATRQRLTTLEALARGRGGGADAVADVFRWQREPPLLMPVLLAAAASPTFLRFRIPKRRSWRCRRPCDIDPRTHLWQDGSFPAVEQDMNSKLLLLHPLSFAPEYNAIFLALFFASSHLRWHSIYPVYPLRGWLVGITQIVASRLWSFCFNVL